LKASTEAETLELLQYIVFYNIPQGDDVAGNVKDNFGAEP
jgi:hypothetical protein